MTQPLSNEALEYLKTMLASKVHDQVERGQGGQPMNAEWTELYNLAYGVL